MKPLFEQLAMRRLLLATIIALGLISSCYQQNDSNLKFELPLPEFMLETTPRILERTLFSAQVRIDNKPPIPMTVEGGSAIGTVSEGLSVGPTIVVVEFFYSHPEFGEFMVASVQNEIDITLEGPNELIIDSLDYALTDVDGDGEPDIDELDQGRNPVDSGAARWSFSPVANQPLFPTVGRNTEMIGFSEQEKTLFGLNSNGSMRWRVLFSSNTADFSDTFIQKDSQGNLYFVDNVGNIYSYTADGMERWTFPVGVCLFNYPLLAFAEDGTVYVNCDDFGLTVLNPDGTLRWYVDFTDAATANLDAENNFFVWSQANAVFGAALDPVRGVVVASADKSLYAYDFDGAFRWRFENENFLVGAPSTDANGNIYFTSINGQLSSLDPDGELRWTSSTEAAGFSTGQGHGTTPVLGDSGLLVARLSETTLSAFDLDGTVMWSLDFGNDTDIGPSSIVSDPVIAADGTIYLSTATHYINAVSPTGELLWQVRGTVREASLELSDDHIYVSSHTVIIEVSIEQQQRTWVFYPNQTIRGTPAIDDNGTLYVGTSGSFVFSIDSLGNFVWEVQVKGRVLNSLSLDNNGNVLVGDMGGYITSISNTGEIRWQTNSEQSRDAISSSVALGSDNTAYAIDGLGDLIAISSEGEFKWRYVTGDSAWFGTPVVSADEIIFASTDRQIYAVNSQGELLWEFAGDPAIQDSSTALPSSSFSSSSLAIGNDDELYAANEDGKLYAINADGSLRWVFDTGFRIRFASPSVNSAGTVTIGNWRDGLIAIDPSGNELWRNTLSGSVLNSATVLADGSLVVGSTNRGNTPENFIFLLAPDGSERSRTPVEEWPTSSVATDQFGNLYLSDGPRVVSFPGGSPLSETAIWPKVHRDNGNTSKVFAQ